MSYKCGTGWQVGCCMRLGAELMWNWGPRLWAEELGQDFWDSGLEESYQLDIPSFCFFCSLLFSIIDYFFGSRPGTNEVGIGFTTSGSQSEEGGIFPRARSTERWPSAELIGSGTFEFGRVRTRHDCWILPFLSFSLEWWMQPRRSAPREGDNVTAGCDPGQGNSDAISSARHEPSIASDNLTYTCTSAITCIHIFDRIPTNTILIHMRLNVGIRALTNYIFHNILKVLKLTFWRQRMLVVLSTLTPGGGNELIGFPKGKVWIIAVPPIMDVKIPRNSSLELLARNCRLREFTH